MKQSLKSTTRCLLIGMAGVLIPLGASYAQEYRSDVQQDSPSMSTDSQTSGQYDSGRYGNERTPSDARGAQGPIRSDSMDQASHRDSQRERDRMRRDSSALDQSIGRGDTWQVHPEVPFFYEINTH